MAYIKDRDFFLEIAKGNVPKHSVVYITGINRDVSAGTVPEDIWDAGGVWVAPTTARIHNIVSTSVNDAAAGTGARTVLIKGLNGSYALTSETITMNGTTNVPTVNSYTIIYSMEVMTVGSGGVNAGVITATAQTDATVTAQINTGRNQTYMAIYQIPDGYKGYVYEWNLSMQQATATSFAELAMRYTPFGGLVKDKLNGFINNTGNSAVLGVLKGTRSFNAKDLITVRATSVTNNNTAIHTGVNLILIQD